MTRTKHHFKRQESWRYGRVKEAWRRPRGVTSRMRKEKAGWPPKVKVGYGTNRAVRNLHPRGLIERLVVKELDLEGLDPKRHIVRLSSRLGERKRLLLLNKTRQLNLRIANPGKEEARPAEEAEEPTAETGTAVKREAVPPSSETLEPEPVEAETSEPEEDSS